MSETQPVLIIGSSGMLHPAVRALLVRGVTAMAVAHRPHRAAPAAHTAGELGEFIPVEGEWSKPGALVAGIHSQRRGTESSRNRRRKG